MKTFKALIAEAKSIHSSYSRWGIMNPDGSLYHGNDHPEAMIHSDLVYGHKVAWAQEMPTPPEANYRDSSWGSDDSRLSTNSLNIRTHGKTGLATAIKHFQKFPHVPGRRVEWDHHDFHDTGAGGNSVKVHNLMKAHYEKHYGKLEDQ